MRRSREAEALALLGLARRAGALVKGTDATRGALREGRVSLLILAEDGARGQLEKVLPLAAARGVSSIELGTKAELGSALGWGPLAVLGVTREGFAREIEKRLAGE